MLYKRTFVGGDAGVYRRENHATGRAKLKMRNSRNRRIVGDDHAAALNSVK